MVRLMNRTIFFSIMLSLSTSFIFAETETEFVNKYIKIRSKTDVVEYLKLVHPKCLVYFKKSGKKDFPKNMFIAFRKRLGVIPLDATVEINEWKNSESTMIYPVNPTHSFNILWRKKNGHQAGIHDSSIINDNGKWYMVIPDYPKPNITKP